MHWKDVVKTLNSCLALYIPESGSEPKNGYAKGYITPIGRQLAVETNTEGERTSVWVEDVGPPPGACPKFCV